MSKITKALEKAARERFQRQQEQATVKATAVELPLEVPSRVGDVTIIDRIQIDPHIVAAADSASPIAAINEGCATP